MQELDLIFFVCLFARWYALIGFLFVHVPSVQAKTNVDSGRDAGRGDRRDGRGRGGAGRGDRRDGRGRGAGRGGRSGRGAGRGPKTGATKKPQGLNVQDEGAFPSL